MNKFVIWTSITFSILLIYLGMIGFIDGTRDLMFTAIYMGSGAFLLVTLMVGSSKDPIAGYLFLAAASILLASYFGINYARNSDFLPYGFMLILSSVNFAASGFSWLDNR